MWNQTFSHCPMIQQADEMATDGPEFHPREMGNRFLCPCRSAEEPRAKNGHVMPPSYVTALLSLVTKHST
jgi:hypothetical protein